MLRPSSLQGYREALLVRTVTDWIGLRGVLRKLTVRQSSPTFEGDLILYSGTVAEKSPTPKDPWITCNLEGKNQDIAPSYRPLYCNLTQQPE